jgi:hypothetical protein
VTRLVGEPARLEEQRLPLFVRQAAALPVSPRVLAPVIEEADVVVHLLERLDLATDELVELEQIRSDVARDIEVHGLTSCHYVR